MNRLLILTVVVVAASAAGAGVAFVTLQDPDESKAGTQEIPEILESWYKVEQKGEDELKRVGFSHFTLTRVGNVNWEYQIATEQDVVIQIGENFAPVSYKSSGKLTKEFEAFDIKGKYQVSNIHFDFRMWIEGRERRIEVTFPKTKPVQISGGDAEGVATDLILAMFQLRQAGSLEKAGRLRLNMLNVTPGGMPRPQAVSLTVMGDEDWKFGDNTYKVTRVDISNFPSQTEEMAVKTVLVDAYGRVVLMETKGGVVMTLAKNSKEAIGDVDRVTTKGRREPFDKDKAMGASLEEGAGSGKTAKDEVPPGTEDEALSKSQDYIANLKRIKEEGGLDAELRATYESFIELYKNLRKVLEDNPSPTNKDRLKTLYAFKREAETYYPGGKKVFDDANSVFVVISNYYKANNCNAMAEQITTLEEFRDRPELEQTEYVEKLNGLISQSAEWLKKCRIREELRAMDITVTGTIDHQKQIKTDIAVGFDVLGQRLSYHRDTVLVHAETFALVVFAGAGSASGAADAYRVGDFLKVRDKETSGTKATLVRVIRIDRFGITVEYKEEVRDIPMQ